MRIAAIRLKHLPPFDDVMFEFPNKQEVGLGEVHIITGQNGTGKTRLLCALASVLGNFGNLQKRIGGASFELRAFVASKSKGFLFFQNERAVVSGQISPDVSWHSQISHGGFYDMTPNQIFTQMVNPIGFRLNLLQENEVSTAFAFRGTTKIVDANVQAMKALPILEPLKNLDFDREDQSADILQAIINLKMGSAMDFLSGDDEDVKSSSRATQVISRIENAVTKISGKKFVFDIVSYPNISIRVRWGGNKISFGGLPDGLRSIIGFLVSCASRMSVDFPEHDNPLDIPVIILMDEPESHLHPAWQQRLIPAAQHMLPNSQMFVVTHSPFVVSSVNSGYLHVLTEKEGKVSVSEPMECSKGDTWVDAVEDALGLKTWYDPETEALLEKFRTLREHVLEERNSLAELETLASAIASRSNSLSQMMGKEMAQVKQLLDKPIVAK